MRRRKRRGRRGRRRRRRRRKIFKYSLPTSHNEVSITETNHLMLQLYGNSIGRSFFPA